MMEFNTTIPRLRSKLQQSAGISVLNAFNEERAKGQMQIFNGVGNASAYVESAAGARTAVGSPFPA